MYKLLKLRSQVEHEVGRFETVKEAADWLYNHESDGDERIARAWEAGDYEECIHGDWRLRRTD